MSKNAIIYAIFFSFICGNVNGDESSPIPDYYSEPGVADVRKGSDSGFLDSIDPFSGRLRIVHNDGVIPGNGGMDLVIKRVYHSIPAVTGILGLKYFPGHSVAGLGWDVHFGRVWYENSLTHYTSDGCRTNRAAGDKNPVLELPDGTRQVLFDSKNSANYAFITTNRWIGMCRSSSEGGGLDVFSPDGTKYEFTEFTQYDSQKVYLLTKKQDTKGNWIKVYYETINGFTVIDYVKTSDGRGACFKYNEEISGLPLISSVRVGSTSCSGSSIPGPGGTPSTKTWRFTYDEVPGHWGKWYLKKVYSSEGKWSYDYYESGSEGLHSLKQVYSIYGGKVKYTYDTAQLEHNLRPPNTVVKYKYQYRKEDGDNASDKWTYTYDPGSPYDTTTVNTPDGKVIYKHHGLRGASNGKVWRIGSLYQKKIYNGNALVQTETYNWESSSYLSNQNNLRMAYNIADNYIYAPRLASKEIQRDGTTYTTSYPSYDSYDNPLTISESGSGNSKTTILTYYINASEWIINRLKNETIRDGAADLNGVVRDIQKKRTFYSNGNLHTESKYCLETETNCPTTEYEYHTTGDVRYVTDPNGKVTEYLDYKRGNARQIILPQTGESGTKIQVNREVDNLGTIASVTNGRGKKTSYEYDSLKRLTKITPPSGAVTNIVWDMVLDFPCTGNCYGKLNATITRGNYEEKLIHDGFGRVVSAQKRDVTDGSTNINIKKLYDAYGRNIFESYPNKSGGTTTTYDALGRPTKITHIDNSYRSYSYLSGNKVNETNEVQKVTNRTYRSYGNPDDRSLVRIESPENILTSIYRDKLGNVTRVWQGENGAGGLQRLYKYNTKLFLVNETNPETDITVYGRDEVGNKVSSKVGSSPTTQYIYDNINRLTNVDYPEGTEDATFIYDDNSNLKHSQKGAFTWDYDYDSNDNLKQEKLTIGGGVPSSYILKYDYNNLDAISQVTYPNGLAVDYSPNALGRPTKAGTYANTIKHHPNGLINEMSYGNGIVTTYAQNDRLFVDNIRAIMSVQGDVVDLQYGYDYVGNVETISDAIVSANSLTLGYDGNNRLTSAAGSWGQGTISYSPQGDIATKNIGANKLTYTYDSLGRLASTRDNTNPARPLISTFTYDIYGNISSKADVTTDGGSTILSSSNTTYDYDSASNLLITGRDNTILANRAYQYDANNYRVIERGENVHRNSIYNKAGLLMYETDGMKCEDTSYIYLGKNLIAKDIDEITGCVPIDNPPVVTSPPDLVVEATSIETPVDIGTATAEDYVDGTIVPTADNLGPFTIGTHTVTWSATDSGGNVGTATQTVVVQDTTAPVLTLPVDINHSAATIPVTLDIGNATATDIFNVTIDNDAPATFQQGATIITWVATDANGNSVTGTQKVVVAPIGTHFMCVEQVQIPVSECEELLDLMDPNNDPEWSPNSQNSPCDVPSVVCLEGHITEINQQGHVTGYGRHLPDLALPYLKRLVLDGYIDAETQFTGEIPDFSNLPNLEYLDLSGNQLSGSVPDFSNLPNLNHLILKRNQLNGVITDLSNLPNLEYLGLSINQFNGEVPDFSNIPKLESLSLGYNQLNGEIPDFSNLPKLDSLEIQQNQLSGEIPNFSNTPNLYLIRLSDNQLSGEIPEFNNLPNLRNLYLDRNHLSGEIPYFSHQPQIWDLHLSGNMLTGEVPTLPFPIMVDVRFDFNALTGDAGGGAIHDMQWVNTQTIPPIDVTASFISSTEVELGWSAVSYVSDPGYYQVFYATTPGGPYTSGPTTSDKSTANLTVSGLTPGITYYFVVKTTTYAHEYNPNDVTSVASVEVSATPVIDADADGIPDSSDNCTQVANADQRDTNGDGYGNVCDADLNNDGIVNTSDVVGLKTAFGSTGPGLDADLNGDEVVDMLDLNLFKGLFGKPPGPSGIAP